MIMTNKIDALKALIREVQVMVEKIDRRMPPQLRGEIDSPSD